MFGRVLDLEKQIEAIKNLKNPTNSDVARLEALIDLKAGLLIRLKRSPQFFDPETDTVH